MAELLVMSRMARRCQDNVRATRVGLRVLRTRVFFEMRPARQASALWLSQLSIQVRGESYACRAEQIRMRDRRALRSARGRFDLVERLEGRTFGTLGFSH